jgi:hypothetical protein
MKPHKPKNGQNKSEKEGKTKVDKKPNQKKENNNKTLSQKSEKGVVRKTSKDNKRAEPKIQFLAYELLASTLSYLMIAHCYYRFVLLPHYELVPPWASVAYV